VQRRIGEGGQAAVYQVLDTRLSVRRAIKILLPHAAEKKKLRARFVGEARAMASLDHPHIARVYDVNADAALPYLVMELVTGGTLAEWTGRHGKMPPRLAVSCVRQVAQGIVAAHAAGVIHRDIKPQNVLVTAEGTCKLTDFGIARLEDANVKTRAGAAMGTQGYMAPEQARDASTVDVRVDVFSLGMLLFALVTNEDPLVRLAGRGLEELPKPLRSLVDRATSFDRVRRQANAQVLLAELNAAYAELPSDPPTAPLAQTEVPGSTVALESVPGSGGEDSTLMALSKMSATPAPARRSTPDKEVRGYTMSRRPAPPQGGEESTPDWIDRENVPAPRKRENVDITVPPPEATPSSPRSATPGSGSDERDATKAGAADEAAAEAKTFMDQVLTTVMNSVLDPWRIAVPALILAVLLGGIPVLQTRELRRQAEEARAARDALAATLVAERPLLDDLDALGADRATLETLYDLITPEELKPARSQALETFLTAVDNEVRFRAAPGIPSYESAKARLLKIRGARAAYTTEMREFDALVGRGFSWGIEP
jgi:serine/threonine protein kinase